MFRLIPIISVCLLILLILGGVFLWLPKLQDFLDLRAELEKKEIELKQKEDYFAKLNSLSKQLEEYPEELAKIDSALPIDPSIPALFNFIQKVSSENGLILEKLDLGQISSSKKKTGVKEISFSISVSGSYPAFKNFLSAIYQNARLIDTDSIKFSSPEGEGLFIFDLTLATYSYLELKPTEQEPQAQELER